MPRPEWVPDATQRRKVAKLIQLARRRAAADAAYKAFLVELADPEGDAIPISHLAKALETTRKTVYRHLGRPMQ